MTTHRESAYWALAHRKATIYGVKCLYARGDVVDALEQLPTEFFSHELLDCDANNDGDIEKFSQKWGLLFHPLRFGEKKPKTACDLPGGYDRVYDTMRLTDGVAREAWKHGGQFGFSGIVSLEESRFALRYMQLQIKAVYACIDGSASEADKAIASQIDALARPQKLFAPDNEYGIRRSGERPYLPIAWQQVDFSLINAIANQIIETEWDKSTDWKRCPWCGHYFKKRRVFSEKLTKTDRQQSNSKYCCEKCSQRMKDYRRDKQKAPDWWTPEQAEAERNKGKRKK